MEGTVSVLLCIYLSHFPLRHPIKSRRHLNMNVSRGTWNIITTACFFERNPTWLIIKPLNNWRQSRLFLKKRSALYLGRGDFHPLCPSPATRRCSCCSVPPNRRWKCRCRLVARETLWFYQSLPQLMCAGLCPIPSSALTPGSMRRLLHW